MWGERTPRTQVVGNKYTKTEVATSVQVKHPQSALITRSPCKGPALGHGLSSLDCEMTHRVYPRPLSKLSAPSAWSCWQHPTAKPITATRARTLFSRVGREKVNITVRVNSVHTKGHMGTRSDLTDDCGRPEFYTSVLMSCKSNTG